jgi:hypothetical protein
MEKTLTRRRMAGGRSRTQNDKVKYQFFISSTFVDLKDERQAVSHAVLELNHIPAGMELFPAFDQSQLEFIKRVIDDCDYYVIILGGRYGSVTSEGISFTESEYDYAVLKEKPVIALLHAKIENIASKNVDTDPQLVEKLAKFRAKLKEGRLVKEWNDINELKSNAIISLTTSFDQIPQMGWRRNDGTDSDAMNARVERYRDELDSFRREYYKLRSRVLTYEELDTAEVEVRWRSASSTEWKAVPSDEIIREFAAPLKKGFNDELALSKIQSLVRHRFDPDVKEILEESVDNVLLFFEVFEIAIRDDDGLTRIVKERLPLLKGAFKSRNNIKSGKIDDEIPF